MVVLTLLTAGVGLALDAYAERQSARDQRRNAALLPQNVSRDTGSSSVAARREDEVDALKELQSYADFQESLSDKILNGLAHEGVSRSERLPQQQPYNDRFLNQTYSDHNCLSQAKEGGLPNPVVIPQGDPKNNEFGWPRVYVPSLMESGIDQQAFLAFIDSFNQSLRLSPFLDVVNVSGISLAISQKDSCLSLATTIPAAVQVAKHAQSDMLTNKLLVQANDMLFRSHGLFAMIVTSLPESPLHTLVVDLKLPLRSKQQEDFLQTRSGNEHADVSTSLPSFQEKATSFPNRKLKDVSNFIAEYSDRRPHFYKGKGFRSPYSQQDANASTSGTSLQMNLAHRRGPLSAFASSISSRHNITAQKRRRRRLGPNSPLEQTSGELRASAGPASYTTDSPIFTRQVEANSIGDSELGMQTGILYLVVVNDAETETKHKWLLQPASSLRQWDGDRCEDKGDADLIRDSDFGTTYQNDQKIAPPAYNAGSYSAGSRSTFGV